MSNQKNVQAQQQGQVDQPDCDQLKEEMGKKKRMLCRLEDELEKYLDADDGCDMSNINNVGGLITTTRNTIIQLETQIKRLCSKDNCQEPGMDSQSIIAAASVRRKLAVEITS